MEERRQSAAVLFCFGASVSAAFNSVYFSRRLLFWWLFEVGALRWLGEAGCSPVAARDYAVELRCMFLFSASECEYVIRVFSLPYMVWLVHCC